MKAPQAPGLLDRLEVEAGRIVLGLGAAMLAAYVGAAILLPKADGRLILGDATHHYVQLRSALYDRDFDFRNDYALLYGFDLDSPEGRTWVAERASPTGLVRNYMPVGPAVAWAPLFGLTSAALWLLAAIGIGSPPTGAERILQATTGITGIVLATAAAWLSWRLATRLTTRRSAAWAAISVWLGSHAIYYTLVSPTYSHAASMFTATVFFAHWIDARARWTMRAAAISGALAGLAALMRWQDAIFLVVPLVECLRRHTTWRARLTGCAAASVAAAVVFMPQMLVWQALYGRPFALPQGPSFLEWTAPNPIAVLFSDYHGLFTWSPILFLAVWGLVQLLRRERDLAWPIGAVLLLSWYINAAVVDWWAGEAFGARRFLSLFPLFVVGLASWLAQATGPRRGWRFGLVGGLVIANGLFFIQYQAFMKGLRDLSPYPGGFFDLWLARFVVPWRLLERWWG